jgi:hypothetical protein
MLAPDVPSRHFISMGALTSLKQFFSRSAPLTTQIANPFLHLDVSSAAREMRLAARAEENGQRELPASDAHMLDGVEREILDRVSAVARQADQESAAQFEAYDSRIAGFGLLTQIPAISLASTQAVGEMKAAVVQANLRLTTARDNVSQSYAQLRAFQSEHGLRRPAQLSKPFMATTGAIILTWVGETVANAFLLGQNDDLGLVGGTVAAATVGGLNIGVAAFVGRKIWPLISLKASGSRTLGIALTALWGLFVLVWNLLAAHYRDAKVAGVAKPEVAALDLFGTAPDSLYSWGLLIAGVLFSIIAAHSAFRMDDPYPGYGEVTREHQSRCADYSGEVEDVTTDLTEIWKDAIETASEARSELAGQLEDRDRAIAGRSNFARRYSQFSRELESAANQLLTIYREANRAARSSPAPSHFDEPFSLPEPPIPPAPKLQVKEADIEAADASLAAASEKLSAAYQDGVNGFETLEALKARLLNG